MDERDKIFICEPVFALASSPMARKFLKKVSYMRYLFFVRQRDKQRLRLGVIAIRASWGSGDALRH